MGYRTLRACLNDLERHGQLVRIEQEVDPHLEAAEIQRRVYRAGGPALYFARVRGCRFPMASNLFGTLDRARWIFRDTLPAVRRLMELAADPGQAARRPWAYLAAARAALNMPPGRAFRAPSLAQRCTVSELPQVTSWPEDGGPFITLPLVHTEDVRHPGWRKANLGMYRVQLAGNAYRPDAEVGLHYQIHRGIGVHHAAALAEGKPLEVNIYVGGPPAMTLAAVMPLPEGMPEFVFAGALGGRRIRFRHDGQGLPVWADADFCLRGVIDPKRRLPEGPFGDHLGYYSLQHDFPVLQVRSVTHRPGAIWPFTTVGRPPQEDTTFGALIHELTSPVIPSVIHGVRAVHAVDAAGVHPLLLAVGSERYVPYAQRQRPQELLTLAHAILGQGQMSLAKYLLIVAGEDQPGLDIHDIAAFLRHLLERIDWRRDLHFDTCTTIDTLDYSGSGFNEGSKVVMAAVGPARRELATELPAALALPPGFSQPRIALPGVVVVQGPARDAADQGPRDAADRDTSLRRFCQALGNDSWEQRWPLWVLVDDSEFAARNLENFLWVTFTRSNPASDIDGVGAAMHDKHWGATGPLVIDARRKPHHAPPLIEDPAVTRRVDQLAARGGPLHGICE